MVKYDKLVGDILILNFPNYCEFLDKTLVDMSKNPNSKIEDVMLLSDKKHELYQKYCTSLQKYKKLTAEQQYILNLYILENQSCNEISFKLGISVRTFFRKLDKIRKIWEVL